MELILKEGLPHQDRAIEAVADVFSNVHIKPPVFPYANPEIDITSAQIKANIERIQQDVHPLLRGDNSLGDYLNLDIKMETGTGKTYVYVRTIFELHRRYGINKFIIAVPSLAIKAGTQQFIKSGYARRHFRDNCRYHSEIDLHILEASKAKKGKKYFPAAVRDFVAGSAQVSNRIHVLVTNMHLFQERKDGMLIRDDYGYGAEGFFQPAEALRATRPLVIIDEPHRFGKEQKTYEFIEKQIQPQCIIRYGATFPDKTVGRGKDKQTVKDYHNLLYDLNACSAFNQNLIKGVSKEHFEPSSSKNEKIKILGIENKTAVKLQHITESGQKTYTLGKNDSLSVITDSLTGIIISGISSRSVEFSNGQSRTTGEEFTVDIYSSSYQELMIKLALERHFETERQNFQRANRIKTLALFFIDDIASYRPEEGKEPYLRNIFERQLRQKIDSELRKCEGAEDADYRNYLLASQADIAATHAGYFAQDNADTDEAVAREVSEILFEKEKLLSLDNADGSCNTRRFLFSKWTLKEGWDNPNVFTIAKLRSSGSENSKLQEVGRGLRLPVDEFGNRIANEEFSLNYIVDFTERDFAEKLVSQINGDLPVSLVISEELLQKTAKKRGVNSDDLFDELYGKKYIDRRYNINPEKLSAFYEDYPEFGSGLRNGKVKDLNKIRPAQIAIRRNNYEELRELWEKLNEKYSIRYENLPDAVIDEQIAAILREGVFEKQALASRRETVAAPSGAAVELIRAEGAQYIIEKPLPYNRFLRTISDATAISMKALHAAIAGYSQTRPVAAADINEHSAQTFIRKFSEWKTASLQGRFSYRKIDAPVHPTKLTNKDGSPREIITQGNVGVKIEPGTAMDKYLYDTVAYDSPLERENILANIEEVVVFGKIPRNSIRIPTIGGETYSPDFMYIVKKTDGTKQLNIILETKDVATETDLRGTEKAKIASAKIFFEQLQLDGYEVKFETQLKNDKIRKIISEALG